MQFIDSCMFLSLVRLDKARNNKKGL